jgi:hypothetical protein
MFNYVVEHELIANSDAKDVICAVGLQRLLQGRLLALIPDIVLLNKVDRGEDFDVGLSLFDRLQDERGLIAVTAMESRCCRFCSAFKRESSERCR